MGSASAHAFHQAKGPSFFSDFCFHLNNVCVFVCIFTKGLNCFLCSHWRIWYDGGFLFLHPFLSVKSCIFWLYFCGFLSGAKSTWMFGEFCPCKILSPPLSSWMLLMSILEWICGFISWILENYVSVVNHKKGCLIMQTCLVMHFLFWAFLVRVFSKVYVWERITFLLAVFMRNLDEGLAMACLKWLIYCWCY